jgi:hypothetical protein
VGYVVFGISLSFFVVFITEWREGVSKGRQCTTSSTFTQYFNDKEMQYRGVVGVLLV